jgi:hypothetical protein
MTRVKPTLTPTERTIRRTRRVLTSGQWFLITGLVFYSLMTTTPLVGAHSKWAWSGFVLGLVVDAAFIMALSAESTLARHGVTRLGRWPVAFRWFTGVSAVFLNVWASVAARDWVGVAVHLIAPALVMLLAEVGPVYMAALADAEQDAPQTPAVGVPEALESPTSDTPPTEPQTPRQTVAQATLEELPADESDAPATRLSNKEADKIIEEGWRHKLSPVEVGEAAQRHPATVRRKYKELDVSLSV